jgi:antitoxin HicB
VKKHIGSSFESFLEEKGIKDDVELRAQKEILTEQIRKAMDRRGISFSALASVMGPGGASAHQWTGSQGATQT